MTSVTNNKLDEPFPIPTLTDVDKDPIDNPKAKKIKQISYTDYLNKDIKVMDATAISLAKDRSLPIIIFSILNTSNILEILDGKGSYSIIE